MFCKINKFRWKQKASLRRDKTFSHDIFSVFNFPAGNITVLVQAQWHDKNLRNVYPVGKYSGGGLISEQRGAVVQILPA